MATSKIVALYDRTRFVFLCYMDLGFLTKGFIIGFSIAAPIGPIGILCIQRSLIKGYLSGVVTGLGAATADVIYGVVAGFGLTFISNFLMAQKIWIQIIGAVFLIYLGITTFLKSTNVAITPKIESHSLLFDYLTTIGFTITNPLTIISFLGVFAGLGLANTSGSYYSAGMLIIGLFFGGALWWVILSSIVSLLGHKFNHNLLHYANKVAGITILTFAAVIVWELVTAI